MTHSSYRTRNAHPGSDSAVRAVGDIEWPPTGQGSTPDPVREAGAQTDRPARAARPSIGGTSWWRRKLARTAYGTKEHCDTLSCDPTRSAPNDRSRSEPTGLSRRKRVAQCRPSSSTCPNVKPNALAVCIRLSLPSSSSRLPRLCSVREWS